MPALLMKTKNAYLNVINNVDDTALIEHIITVFEKKAKITESDMKIIGSVFGFSHEHVEQKVFDILSSFFHAGRYHANPIKVDEDELAMGIEVEYEHCTSPYIAKRIALDHLAEKENYYTKLAIMENE